MDYYEPLSKGGHGRGGDACSLPPRAPVQRIVRIIRGLWNKNVSMRALDEVVASNVGHDLSAGQDFDVELLFELATLLR